MKEIKNNDSEIENKTNSSINDNNILKNKEMSENKHIYDPKVRWADINDNIEIKNDKKLYSEIAQQNSSRLNTNININSVINNQKIDGILFEFYTHQIVWDIKTQKYDENNLCKINLIVNKKDKNEIKQIILYNKNENTIALIINDIIECYPIDTNRRTIQYKFKEKK